jgi:uncharacterized cysteine cluster protein YcgN (CxxCxxCC family)
MTKDEWEALCDGCGLCCKLGHEQLADGRDVACPNLDTETNRCKTYTTRFSVDNAVCLPVTPQNVEELWRKKILPDSCGYVRHMAGFPPMKKPPEAELVAFELAPRGFRRRYKRALRKWQERQLPRPR